MPPEDLALFHERMLGFSRGELPSGDVETYLVATAALATVRLDRCARTEFAVMAQKRREAIKAWRSRQERQAARRARRLHDDPEGTVAALMTTTAGCDWLLDRWDELAEMLDQPGGWDADAIERAHDLAGRGPGGPADDEPRFTIRLAALALRGDATADEVDALYNICTAGLDPEARAQAIRERLPEPPAAVEALKSLAVSERRRIEGHCTALFRTQDSLALSEAIDLATTDTSHDGMLRRRYESAASLDLHRALERLRRHRAEANAGTAEGEPPTKWLDSTPSVESARQCMESSGLARGLDRPEPAVPGTPGEAAGPPAPAAPAPAPAPATANLQNRPISVPTVKLADPQANHEANRTFVCNSYSFHELFKLQGKFGPVPPVASQVQAAVEEPSPAPEPEAPPRPEAEPAPPAEAAPPPPAQPQAPAAPGAAPSAPAPPAAPKLSLAEQEHIRRRQNGQEV